MKKSQVTLESVPDVAPPPEDAPMTRAHWGLMSVLVIALVIDIMKPASLGFTIPGMVSEYGVSKKTASLVPFFALSGTVVGSIVWGIIADIYGRKASILLSAVMFGARCAVTCTSRSTCATPRKWPVTRRFTSVPSRISMTS